MKYNILVLLTILSTPALADSVDIQCRISTWKEGAYIGARAHRFNVPGELKSILTDKGYSFTRSRSQEKVVLSFRDRTGIIESDMVIHHPESGYFKAFLTRDKTETVQDGYKQSHLEELLRQLPSCSDFLKGIH